MKRDDERAELKRLHGQLDALDADIETARRDLVRATTAHFEEYFQGPRVRRPAKPSEGEPFRLRDGTTVLIRPVEPADSSLLMEGFRNLSAVSRYRRFLYERPDPSEAEAKELTQVDHRDHEALVAVDAERGEGTGIARYVCHKHDPTRAIAAVTVVDAWQGRGLGTELLKRLSARARAEGIEHFEAHMIVGDDQARRMFESVGRVETSARSAGTLDVTVSLAG
jgi:GNAT superfamily N-acetyltransferase